MLLPLGCYFLHQQCQRERAEHDSSQHHAVSQSYRVRAESVECGGCGVVGVLDSGGIPILAGMLA